MVIAFYDYSYHVWAKLDIKGGLYCMQNFLCGYKLFLKENWIFLYNLLCCFELYDTSSPFFLSRLLWNMSSQKDTPMNALNFSPTSLEGNSPTWTMRSRYRRQACVLKRLSLCRKGISTVAWVLPAFLPSPLLFACDTNSLNMQLRVIGSQRWNQAGSRLALLSLLPFSCSSDQMRVFRVLFSSSAWALWRALRRTSFPCFHGIK